MQKRKVRAVSQWKWMSEVHFPVTFNLAVIHNRLRLVVSILPPIWLPLS